MAQHELEAALRRQGDDRAHKIWHSSETAAGQLRNEAAQIFAEQQRSAAERRRVQNSALREAALAAARKHAQNCRLQTEDELAERLMSLAQGLLEELACAGGSKLFQSLSAEIPAYPWQRITVNPRDQSAAGSAFPEAEIVTDPAISAGLEVQSADDEIQIINTLEKRLIHLWPQLQVELFKEIRPMAGDDESFA